VLLVGIVTLAAAVGVGAWLWSRGVAVAESPPAAPPAAAEARPPAPAGEAKPAAPPMLEVPGTLEAFEVTDVFAKVSGYIRGLSVDIGDHVKAGQTLMVIDVPELVKELAQVRAEEAARAASLKSAEAGVVAAQARLEVAQRQLVPFQAVAKLKDVTHRRVSDFFQGKAANAQDMDEIQAGRDAAAADVEVARTKIAAAEADLKLADAAVALAARELEVARAQVERTAALASYMQVVAPYDGIVSRRLINLGVLVQAATATQGGPLLTLQKTDVIRVFAEVPESHASKVPPSTPAEVIPYGLDGQAFHGTVTRTASSLNPATRTLRVEIDLANPDGRLMHGMYAQVRFQMKEAAKASR
jgi:multidrug efflux pump subunit AcrA (membrane-fusion protein)